ncbi:hypothetical protein SAMN04488009_0044 [Maribacter sedimenticola]|uniref:Uncharacterized protein n=1 Tax=Maribacter sedimenticola TaxID=228956 RepID=A0ABY1SLX4_9FLAO|nr:hypothetical protein SAMN04488009_0044 [Maribacter sedimenticola]
MYKLKLWAKETKNLKKEKFQIIPMEPEDLGKLKKDLQLKKK